MSCPFCSSQLNRVIDKRGVVGSGEIRRRRQCLKCIRRFTTYERILDLGFLVIKRDGQKQIFDKNKLRVGIAKALEKRPTFDQVGTITDKVERKLKSSGSKEITSKIIGKMVLSELKKLDKVAYLRFASVYRQFKDPSDFAKELTALGG